KSMRSMRGRSSTRLSSRPVAAERRRRSMKSFCREGETMSQVLHLGEIIAMNARLFPEKIGGRDLTRSLTFRQWNERACRLANALVGIGLAPGDRLVVLAYNRLEWLEIYAAVAKAGVVLVPVNFRLLGPEIRYIVENAEAKAIVVEDVLLDRVEGIRTDLAIADD